MLLYYTESFILYVMMLYLIGFGLLFKILIYLACPPTSAVELWDTNSREVLKPEVHSFIPLPLSRVEGTLTTACRFSPRAPNDVSATGINSK